MITELINNKVIDPIDFEWQSKLRVIWTSDNEAEAVCGGWNQRFGYEYLGTQQKLVITPLTSRYFVFIASALRERSSIMLQCGPHNLLGSEIVSELSELVNIPYKTVFCGSHSTISSLTSLLNGAAMADTWIFFEHLDKLSLTTLTTFLKEVQLLQQQFIISNFNKNLIKNRNINQTQQQILENMEVTPTMRTLGIFAS